MFTIILMFCALGGGPCVERKLPVDECPEGVIPMSIGAQMQAEDMSISADRWSFAGWTCRVAEEHA